MEKSICLVTIHFSVRYEGKNVPSNFRYVVFPKLKFNLHVLQDHKYFEDAFKVYERGVKIFKYPHVKDIWVTYLSKFVKRYGKSKLERSRELFEHAVEMVRYWSIVHCIYAYYVDSIIHSLLIIFHLI